MSLRNILSLITAFTLFSLSTAICQFHNNFEFDTGDDSYRIPELCKPQGAGVYTLSFYKSATNIPSGDPSVPFAGYATGETFLLYDNTCKLLGVYPRRNDCSPTWVIRENYLPYEIDITHVSLDLGNTQYIFNYANGLYSIRDNGCGCEGVSHGIVGAVACKCAFPIHGQPTS